jgi:hypothetical protein
VDIKGDVVVKPYASHNLPLPNKGQLQNPSNIMCQGNAQDLRSTHRRLSHAALPSVEASDVVVSYTWHAKIT